MRRLPVYLRFLKELSDNHIHTVSSGALGEKLELNPTQIRKDLAYFGDFGRKGIGYNVDYLTDKIREILKLDRSLEIALIGTGNLGHALCNYTKFIQDNIKIVAAFDEDPNKIGQTINTVTIQSIKELANTIRKEEIKLAILAVPGENAQEMADCVMQAGVKGILNFTPIVLKSLPKVRIHNVDFTTELLSLSYYVENQNEQK